MISTNSHLEHDDAPEDNEDLSEEARKKLWLDELNVVVPDRKPCTEAPVIDQEALKAFDRGELSNEEGARILILTLTFECWAKALCLIQRENVK